MDPSSPSSSVIWGAGGHCARLEEYFFQLGMFVLGHDSEPGLREKMQSNLHEQRKRHRYLGSRVLQNVASLLATSVGITGRCFPQLAQMLTLKLAKRETENGECFELGGVEGPVTYVRLPFFLFFF